MKKIIVILFIIILPVSVGAATTGTSFSLKELIFTASSATTDKIQLDNLGSGEIIWLDTFELRRII